MVEGGGTIANGHGRLIISWGYGQYSVRDEIGALHQADKQKVVDPRCLPLQLFLGPVTPSKVGLFRLLQRFGPPLSYPAAAVRGAIFDATLGKNEEWFAELLSFAFQHGVDIPQTHLFWEMYTRIVFRRNWTIMKAMCGTVSLPDNFRETTLEPDVNSALRSGDETAQDFLQCLADEGWGNIQSRCSVDNVFP